MESTEIIHKIRIGIILGDDIETSAIPPLKFLILRLNTLQTHFEYEFLPILEDDFLTDLQTRSPLDRHAHKQAIPGFIERYEAFLIQENLRYKLREALPNCYILISLARFSDEYYLTGNRKIGIIALGNWERMMAPPSLLEFILTTVVIESVFLLGKLPGIGHLGTKGCLFDFNANLADARYGALQSFICRHCRGVLAEAGHGGLGDQLVKILDKSWFGSTSDNLSVAGVISNFKYDLFLTKGIRPTRRERLLAFLREDGMKELIRLLAEILLAAALLYLGLKKG